MPLWRTPRTERRYRASSAGSPSHYGGKGNMLRQPASREPFAAWLAGAEYGSCVGCIGEERRAAAHELPGRSVTHCGQPIRQLEGESRYARASKPASRAFTAGHSSSVMLNMTVSRWG